MGPKGSLGREPPLDEMLFYVTALLFGTEYSVLHEMFKIFTNKISHDVATPNTLSPSVMCESLGISKIFLR